MLEKYAFLNALNLRTGLEDDQEEAKDMEDGFPAEPLIKKNKEEPEQKIDELYITTTLGVIENPDKKNSKDLRAELEELKTRIFKYGNWNKFKQSPLFNKCNKLIEIHKPKRS